MEEHMPCLKIFFKIRELIFSVEMTDLKAVEADFEFREKNRIAKDTNFFYKINICTIQIN
jgi:hypothetical protein